MCALSRLILLAAILSLSGCAGAIDAEQLGICRRVLSALHPDGVELREIRFRPAPLAAAGVRIDYAVRVPGGEMQAGFVECRFSGSGLSAERLDLAAVRTNEGALGEARLYFLKRYWLALPRAGARVAPPPVVELPANLAYAAQHGVNAFALAAIYGLLATTYSLIYGLVGRISLGFGEIAVVGAYGAIGGVAAVVALGFNDPVAGLVVAWLIAVPLAALWSRMFGTGIVAPLHARFRLGQPILVATAAMAVTIQEFLRLFQGVRERWMPPVFSSPIPLARAGDFVVTVTPMQLLVALAALAAAGALLWMFAQTHFGRQWRAFADDPHAAQLFGVAPARLLASTFVLAGLNAGLAGWIVAVYYGNVGFAMGTTLGLKALLAAIVGGIGKVEGAFAGGVLIGVIEAAWSAYFDIASRDIVVFTLLIVLFVLRPGGLVGLAGPRPREV
jgi:branched-subunit amino acid ABC-type transport system permease component